MPSEAEIEAAAREIWNDFHGRMGGEWPGKDSQLIVVIQCMATARAALSAAPAVRSEPVAWQWINGAGQLQFATFRPTKGEAPHGYTPLYTSPVQTREDDALRRLIRNVPSIIEDHVCGGSDTRPVVDIDGLVGALTENVSALLSQPEPRGDKT
jgi:hypothetical protein